MIAKLGKDASKYYYEKDSIFNEEGQGTNLSWHGKGAEELGLNLNDKVDKKEFEEILDGKHNDKNLRYLDKKNEGEDRKAYDMVFSASKSISHLALVMGEQKVIDAFDKATKSALDYVESLAQVRNYQEDGTRQRETTGNLVIAQAKHSTARPVAGMVDPSLHTHNLIMNATQDKNGDWKSLSMDNIYKNQSVIKEVFKSELAKNLKDAGYGINVNSKGDIEIAGYNQEIIDQFSKRHQQINEIKSQLRQDDKYKNMSSEKLDLIAQHSFKQDKIDISKEDLKESWDKQTEQIISKDKLLKDVLEAGKEQSKQERLTASEGLKLAIAFKTETEVAVSESQLMATALKIGRGDYTYNDLKNEITKIEKDTTKLKDRDLDSVIPLGDRINKKGDTERFYTKVEHFENERKILENISKGNKIESIMSSESAEKHLKVVEEAQKFKLSDDQKASYMKILTSEDQFIIINGLPGTGKTTLLSAVRYATEMEKGVEYAEKLYNMLATTGKAAAGAQEETKMISSTVHSFLNNKGNLSEGSIKEIVEQRLEEQKKGNTKDNSKIDVMKNYEEKQKKIENLENKIGDNKTFTVSKYDEKNIYKNNNENGIEHKRNSILEDRKLEVLKFREQNIANLPTKAHTEGLREFGRDTHKGVSVGLSGVFKHKKSFDGSTQSSWVDHTAEGRRTNIKQSGKIELKDPDTKQNLGIKLDFNKKIEIQEKGASTTTKTDTSFSDGTKQKTISTTSNLFGSQSSYGAKTLFGNDKRDAEGNRIFKTTISKKASDLLYKSEKFEHVKSSQDDKYKRGFEKNEKSVLGGLLYKSESSAFGKKEGNIGIVERETKGSILGGMIKFENSNFDFKKNGVLQETGTKTDIYVFGKKVENNFIKGMLNSSTLDGTYKTTIEKVEGMINKTKEITSSVSSYFNKDKELEYKKITTETKGVKIDEMKTIEMSKIDKDKTAVSVSSYSKNSKKEGYELDITKTKVIDKSIESLSAETGKLKEEMKLSSEIMKEERKDSGVKFDSKETKENFELSALKSVILMDEASMSDTKVGSEVIQHAIDTGARMVFIGDTYQQKSVGAGEVYDRVLEKGDREDLTTINRQRNADEETKLQVVKMTSHKVKDALEILENQGKFKEGSKEEFMEVAKEKMLKDQDKTLVLFQKNDDVNKFNEIIRESKYGKETLEKAPTIETHQDKRMDGEKKFFAHNYEKGDVIGFKTTTASGKERVSEYKVEGIDKEKNKILVSSDKKTFSISLTKESKNVVNVFKVEQKSFLEGDKVMFLKNDKKQDVMNGQIGTVKSFDSKTGNIVIDFDGKEKSLNLNNSNSKKINHAYGVTGTKSQGMTVNDVLAYIESRGGLTNFNSANVMGSRHRTSYEMWTDSKEALKVSIEKDVKKETTLTKDELKEFEQKDFKKFKNGENFIKGEEKKSDSSIKENIKDFDPSKDLKTSLGEHKSSIKEDNSSNKDFRNQNSLNSAEVKAERNNENVSSKQTQQEKDISFKEQKNIER